MLTPGNGKTKTGRLRVYLRDEGDHAGPAPPAAFYRYSPNRKGERPKRHLKHYQGHLYADGYARFEELNRSGKIKEVACLAHVRRKFFGIHQQTDHPLRNKRSSGLAHFMS